MERRISDRTILDSFVEEFCEIMEKHAKFIVCSGFVAIAHGRTRGTEDVDMIIEPLTFNQFSSLHKELVEKGFQCIQSDEVKKLYEEYLKNGISIRYVWKSETFAPPEMEVKFTKDILDMEQIRDRQKLELTGLNVYFSSIESNIAFKEEYLGTNKDMEDAKHLRIIYSDKIDENKIKSIKDNIIKLRKSKNE